MAEKQSVPNYYAVIPAEVRYSGVSANAKLLYGEITALASKEGYCWASNQYFADLYGATARAVSRWVSELADAGFVTVAVDKNYLRKIMLGTTKTSKGYDKNSAGGTTKLSKGVRQNSRNSTTENNTSSNTKSKTVLSDDCYATAELLHDSILERYPNNKIAPSYRENWAKEVDLMIRIDGRNVNEIKACIFWAFTVSDFWHRQIWSGSNLRKHFDKMSAQAQSDMPKIIKAKKEQLARDMAQDKITVAEYKEAMRKLG